MQKIQNKKTQKEGREKEKTEKSQGACRGETTELRALWCANHNPLLPAPTALRDGWSQESVGAALEHRGGSDSSSWDGREIQASVNRRMQSTVLAVRKSREDNCTWTGKGVQSLSLDFLKRSQTVIFSCWSLCMNNVRRGKQTLCCNLLLWTSCDDSLQESV